MVRTDKFIRSRKLTDHDVVIINYVLKSRASRFIAAGQKHWLYPERTVSEPWRDIADTILPPKDELWQFGGETFAKFNDGHVHYQDEFGRTEKQRDFLIKEQPTKPLRPKDGCGCGSGLAFRLCCSLRPVALRPTWIERSIRERNIMLCNGIEKVLGFAQGKNWTQIRRELTDEQIGTVYSLYEGLWPLETDLLQLLPKPDGRSRAVYTGSIHPDTITEFALGASLYFGELIIEHPFLHAGTVKKDFSPVENPKVYRQEFLKSVVFLLSVMPLVNAGLVNLVPDPCNFDLHLRDQMLQMAQSRAAGIPIGQFRQDARMEQVMKDDAKCGLLALSKDALRQQFRRSSPNLDEAGIEIMLEGIEQLKERDPLATLQEGSLDDSDQVGQLQMMKLSPNFEMTMYLAQATGASIVTDNAFRWSEIKRAIRRQSDCLPVLTQSVQSSGFAIPREAPDIVKLGSGGTLSDFPVLIASIFKYLSSIEARGQKPNIPILLVPAKFAAKAMLAERAEHAETQQKLQF